MEKKTQLTRGCIACGIEKPLAAFLQISGTQGTVYGNICSSCRSDGAKGKNIVAPTDDDDREAGSTGLRIDSKKKIKTEQINREEAKKLKEKFLKEDELDEEAKKEKAERAEIKAKSEKDHREKYIEIKKKESFLGYQIHKQPLSKQTIIQKQQQERVIKEHHEKIEIQKVEEAVKHETKLNTIDMSQIYLGPQFGELKYQSEIFKRFKEWMGKGANFRMVEQLYQPKAPSNKAVAAEKTQAEKIQKEKDPLIEQIEKTWNPSSSSRKR